MEINKKRGSYYTPVHVADFIYDHVLAYFGDKNIINILEPSVGDGVFVTSLHNTTQFGTKKIFFTGIEKYVTELRKAKSKSQKKHNTKFNFINGDFLTIQETLKPKFQIIVGNPPFIKKDRLSKSLKAKCNFIHSTAGLSEKSAKNIWSSFLIRCVQLLAKDGVLAFILPSDFLQVKFSNEIRDYLTSQFDRIEIFTFNNLLFEKIGQDTILLVCIKNTNKKGIFFEHISNFESLQTRNFILKKKDSLSSAKLKWTHNVLSNEEINFLLGLQRKTKTISDYCTLKPGVVTAANDYFIINSEIEKKFSLEKYTRDIIRKGSYVNGKLSFTNEDIIHLSNLNKSTKLLTFKESDEQFFDKKIEEYLELGVKLGINSRYKCKIRKSWFVIPNIGKPTEGFFFKRCHQYPKMIINEAKVLATDSAYNIIMNENYSIENLIYSFYNSLTLIFSELQGRYYGDGVLELTPTEFKSLPIIYSSITVKDFNKFKNLFESKKSIDDILRINDYKILTSSLNITSEEITKLHIIRNKLIHKRFHIP